MLGASGVSISKHNRNNVSELFIKKVNCTIAFLIINMNNQKSFFDYNEVIRLVERDQIYH